MSSSACIIGLKSFSLLSGRVPLVDGDVGLADNFSPDSAPDNAMQHSIISYRKLTIRRIKRQKLR
jgi:hypothetical protein